MCLKAGLCPLVGGVGAHGIPEPVSVYWWSKLFQKIVLVQWWAELFPRVSGCRALWAPGLVQAYWWARPNHGWVGLDPRVSVDSGGS